MTHPQCSTSILYHVLKKPGTTEPWLGEFQHPGAVVSSSQGGAQPMRQHLGTPVQLHVPGFGLTEMLLLVHIQFTPGGSIVS